MMRAVRPVVLPLPLPPPMPAGRLVSTSVTAMVAGAVAWLAAGAVPPGLMRDTSHDRALMPYQLFLQLAKSGEASYASIAPGFIPGSTRAKKPVDSDAPLTAEDGKRLRRRRNPHHHARTGAIR